MNISPTLRKTVVNLGWLFVDRGIRMSGAVVINAWLTRYLGPEQNGVLNYALAFVGMFTPLATLGIDSIVIRDIVRNPEQRDRVLGSAFGLRLAGAVSALLFAGLAVTMVRPGDTMTHVLVVVTSFGLLFQSFDVIDQWFQSQIRSKYTVYAKNIAFVVIGAVKIGLILTGADVLYFVIATSAELMLGAAGLAVMYRRNGGSLRSWSFSAARARELLRNSWPIIITDVAIFVQTRIDQVMLRELLGEREIGLYAAAQKIAEPLGFVPMIILSSVFPVIVRTKEWSDEEYGRRLTNLYRIMTVLTIAMCLPISLLSGPIVQLLYGDQFAASASILTVLIWSRFYSNIGVARSIYTTTEGLFRHSMVSAMAGSAVNITLNALLIPRMGVFGCIVAAHAGFIVTTFAIDAFNPKTKRNFRAMMTGIATFHRVKISTNQ
ncbi:MAG: flippase [Bacteroidetes bacterium]|nr:MAG: flippase [Bacteroidota bacterium]